MILSRDCLTYAIVVCATFAFSTSEGNVGVDLQSQVLISSRAHASSKPFTISQVKVAFGGNLKNFIIQHDPSQAPPASSSNGLVHIYGVPLQRASPEASLTPTSPATSKASQFANDLTGLANLTIVPGATKAFSIDHVPRDAGEAEVASLTLCLNEDDFDLKVIITEDEQLHQSVFWVSSETGPTVKTLKSGRSSTVKILPKPPKLQIECRNVALTYYTDEVIDIDVWVMNDEDEEANVTLEARLVGSGGPLPHIAWTSAEEDEELRAQSAEAEQLGQSEKTSISQAIGNVASSSEQSHGVHIHALPDAGDYVVEVRARYYLLSDPETPISKFSSANIFIKLPFEVSYSFTPMINPEPWPSYFNVDELGAESEDAGGKEEQANGLIQMWQLMSRIYSLASEAFNIDHVDPRVLEIHEAASCNITPGPEDTSKLTSIAPNDLQERSFHLKAQKTDLEDRRSTFLDLRLEVSWRRGGSQKAPTVTYLAVPELVIPFGEPRVLATAKNGEEPPGVIHLQYVIENPSTYALAFSLTMDPSEDFAFSGPKNVSVELLPLSRHTVPYNLMPLVKGAWITPQLRVFDTHFHKALKVNATEGMRSDKKGLSIWVNADG